MKRVIAFALMFLMFFSAGVSVSAASWCSFSIDRIDHTIRKTLNGRSANITCYYDLVSVQLADKQIQAKVNEALFSDLDTFIAHVQWADSTYLGSDDAIKRALHTPFYYYVENESVFVNREYVSVKNVSSWYFGGVFNGGYFCKTIDLKTGNVVTLPNYLGMSHSDTKEYVQAILNSSNLLKSSVNSYLDTTSPDDYEFYIDLNGNLHLVFDSYTVGASADGSPDFKTGWEPAIQPDFFVDVDPDTWYTSAVDWAVDYQPAITNGISETLFSPDSFCTRGQVVTFLWRAAGCPEPSLKGSPFLDVDARNSYYSKAVLWAYENRIAQGIGNHLFAPEETITRAQAVTFLWRANQSPKSNSINPFLDVADGEYYVDAVLWAVENKITLGTSNSTFSPNSFCTRSQTVTFLYRLFNPKEQTL